MDRMDSAYRGQKHYTPAFLNIYDVLVLTIYGPLLWWCSTQRLVQLYERNVGRRHMDVGPGTGYFLEHASLRDGTTILLVDPNPHVLAHASRRLAHVQPSVLQADVLKQLAVQGQRFDSVGLNFVLHCLPGPMARKAVAVHNLAAVLEPDGVLFGSTLLGERELHTWLSYAALRQNNWLGFFDNLGDSLVALREILCQSFEAVDLEVVGAVALFTAAKPRPDR